MTKHLCLVLSAMRRDEIPRALAEAERISKCRLDKVDWLTFVLLRLFRCRL